MFTAIKEDYNDNIPLVVQTSDTVHCKTVITNKNKRFTKTFFIYQ